MNVMVPAFFGVLTACLSKLIPQGSVVFTGSSLYIGIQPAPSVNEFRGIHFAQPPTHHLRFVKPVAAFQTYGINWGRNFGLACPQRAAHKLSNGMGEDCLSLNIVRPSKTPHNAPVVVWVHGGNNNNGQSCLYNGTRFVEMSQHVDMPIIFVSVNYRLNGFGFLASTELASSRNVNLGLYDQELALEWIRDNIEYFGGDPQQVTIMGESAGAANAWAQVACRNRPKPLVHRAILLSGAPGAVHPHGK